MPPLPTIQRPTPIRPASTPRAAISLAAALPGARAARASTERGAASVRSQTASETSALGARVAGVATSLFEPFEKLNQSREITRANDIVVGTVLDIRAAVRTVTSSGGAPETLVPLIEVEFTKRSQAAITAARRISPAAVDHVTRALADQRLQVIGGMQKVAFTRDVQEQQAALARLDTFTRQGFFEATDPGARLRLQDNLFRAYDIAVATGLMSAPAAEKRQSAFNKFVTVESAAALSRTQGVGAGIEVLDASESLIPSERRAAEANLLNTVRTTLSIDGLRDAEAEETLERTQELVEAQLSTSIIRREQSPADASEMLRSLPRLLEAKALSREGHNRVQGLLARRLADARMTGTENTASDVISDAWRHTLAVSPEVPVAELANSLTRMGVKGRDLGRFIGQHTSSRNPLNFKNRPIFTGIVKQMRALQPGPFDRITNPGRARRLATDAEREYIERILAVAGGEGINVTDTDLRAIGDSILTNLQQTMATPELNVLDSFGSLTLEELNQRAQADPSLADDPNWTRDLWFALLRKTGLPHTSTVSEVMEALRLSQVPVTP